MSVSALSPSRALGGVSGLLQGVSLLGLVLLLIKAAQLDLHIAGVIDSNDALVKRAIITYVKMHTGNPPDYDHLKASYDEQKAQLMVATGYTQWQ